MNTLKNLMVFQNSISPAYCLFKCTDRVNWTEWVFEKPTGFQSSYFFCLGWGWGGGGDGEWGGSVGVLMRFVWVSLDVGWVCWGGCLGEGEWVSLLKWHSLYDETNYRVL